MGVFKHSDFGVSNPFNGTFLVTPTTTVPSEVGAPGTVYLRNFGIFIGAFPDLESPFLNPAEAQ